MVQDYKDHKMRNMKEGGGLLRRYETQKLGCGAMVKCLLLAMIVLSILNPAVLRNSVFQRSEVSTSALHSTEKQETTELREPVENHLLTRLEVHMSAFDSKKNQDDMELESPLEKEQSSDLQIQNSGMICEFSHYRYNMCSIKVNLKVIGSSGNVLLIPPTSTTPANTTVWKIRPFTRKWEEETMSHVRELTIQWESYQNQGPSCEVTHDVPVLIFATAGFPYNPFHAYSDSLIPLFVAANPYNGKIQFAVTNVNWPFINKYMTFIKALSHYPVINLDSETQVHCFPSGEVGLRGTGPLTVDNSSAQNGYRMQDFMFFLKRTLSLERTQIEIIEKNSSKKPQIGILLRKGTRTFVNENEILEMAEGVGFKVIRLDPETTSDFPRIAHFINSCDVLMGMHGAGLTNMLYLPENAIVIQIVPWGNLQTVSWKVYGEPAKGMGLNYVQYEIKEHESTLTEKYPRNHTVFTNPQELNKQGWNVMYSVYLVEQSVKLDVHRFRKVLVDVFNSLTEQ